MKRWIPTRERMLQSRWLRPIARHLDNDHLWHADRHSVARAVAIGLFFGLALPVAQFLFAVMAAIVLRAHVAIAAAFTLVTNPLTFAPIYWLAYRIGSWLLGGLDEAQARRIEQEAAALAEQEGFMESLWYAVQAAGAPLALGLVVMGIVASLLGFGLAWLLWRPRRTPSAPTDPPPRST